MFNSVSRWEVGVFNCAQAHTLTYEAGLSLRLSGPVGTGGGASAAPPRKCGWFVSPTVTPALSPFPVFPSSLMTFQRSGPCAGADWCAFSRVWVDVTQGCEPRPSYTSCLLKGVGECVCV